MTRRWAGGRSPSEGGPRAAGVVAAASYEARVLACARRSRVARRASLLPGARHRPPRLREIRRSVGRCSRSSRLTPLVEPLSLDEGTRRHRELLGRALAVEVARGSSEDPEETGLTRRTCRRNRTSSSEDRVGMEEAGRSDGISPDRSSGSFPSCRSTRCGGVGRSRRAAPRAGIERLSTYGARATRSSARPSVVGGVAAPPLVRRGRSAGDAETTNASRSAARRPSRRDLTRPEEIRKESRRSPATPRLRSSARRSWRHGRPEAAVLELRATIHRSETRQPPTASEEEIVARTVARCREDGGGTASPGLLGASLHNLVEK